MTLLGMILIVIGGFALLITGWTISLTRLGPGRPDLTLKTSWMDLIPFDKQEMKSVQTARVMNDNGNGGDTETGYRIELDTREGIIPLNFWYSAGYESKKETVEHINAFLRTPSAKTLVLKHGSIPGVCLSGFSFVSGILLLFLLA